MRSHAAWALRPVANVAEGAQGFVATSTEPWLSIDGLDLPRLAGRFVEIVYRLSFWDEPVRPVFRFWTDGGVYVDHIGAGPITGAGIWVGRVPPATRRLDVSPTCREGVFGFRIECVRPLPWLAVVARGLVRQPARTRSALLTRLIGWHPESDANLAWATGAIPFSRFETWRAERAALVRHLPHPTAADAEATPVPVRGRLFSRKRDLCRTLSARRSGRSEAEIRNPLRMPEGRRAATMPIEKKAAIQRNGSRVRLPPPRDDNPQPAQTLLQMPSKREKDCPARCNCRLDTPRFDWSRSLPIRIVIGGGDAARSRRTLDSLHGQVFSHWRVVDDPRICTSAPDPHGSLTCWIGSGDVLAPEALAVAAEQAHRHPDCRLFYADALRIDARGRATPCFQPRWSQRFHAEQQLDATVVFVRDIQTWSLDERQRFRHAGEVAPSVLSRLSSSQVRPLCRLLIETDRPRSAAVSIGNPVSPTAANISIIIPTRDQPALLQRCVASIRAHAGTPQLVIVDNASVTEPARHLLAELSRAPDTIVLPYPHPFNFSAMCNAAAAIAGGDILVFLNDDTKILSADWLDRLAAHAADPSISAVGAKLVYPDGRLQHAGIVVGMGGSAGHFGAFAPADDPGWADRAATPHEVSAVTGACLAVERSKFSAVGGFDETHLPVELSDVDLCLKLNARGWQTLLDPGVTILHEESASRGGATFRRLAVYESQRKIFVERWRHVLRDDPCFHPGLSLYSFAPALA